MSRIEVPLLDKIIRATGDIVLRAEVDLLVRTNTQNWEPVAFRVDSGTEMTSMAVRRAQMLDVPFPRRAVHGVRFGQAGHEVRSGVLRVQVVGMDSTEYIIPCYFLGDPAASPATMPISLLGLTGVVDKLRLTFDGKPGRAGAPHGILVVERQ